MFGSRVVVSEKPEIIASLVRLAEPLLRRGGVEGVGFAEDTGDSVSKRIAGDGDAEGAFVDHAVGFSPGNQ